MPADLIKTGVRTCCPRCRRNPTQDVAIPAFSRRSFRPNDCLTGYDVSARVVSSGGAVVVVERDVYGGARALATCSICYAS